MPLLYRQARSQSPTFLDSPEGLVLWREMEADVLNESIKAAGFSSPVLVVQCAASGFMSAGVCRGELSHCAPITETAAPPGLFFPVRAFYISSWQRSGLPSTSSVRSYGAARAGSGNNKSSGTPLPCVLPFKA